MGKAYRDVNPEDPYDLSTPSGILSELKDEAAKDVADAVSEATEQVASGAAHLAAETSKAAHAAVDHPVKFGSFALRSVDRYIRQNPAEAAMIFGGLGFAVGGLYGQLAQKRWDADRVKAYLAKRHAIRTFPDHDGISADRQQRRATDPATDNARDATSDALEWLSARASDAMKDPSRFTRDSVDNITRYTQDRPLQALGIAAAMAFVAGTLWKR
jgi:ElaB/YqjD/DUF883 family membrane-anchored ribosome-binding protein